MYGNFLALSISCMTDYGTLDSKVCRQSSGYQRIN